MRLIDADELLDRAICTRNYFEIKSLIEWMPSIPPPPNAPLTLEQLLEMNGDPVWTVTLSVEGSGRWELCTCEVVTACPLHKVLRCVTATGEVTDYEIDTYGKTWTAYRRKPEEATP